jgi:hypothetical protein
MNAGVINPDHGSGNAKLFYGELALDGSNPTPIPVAFRDVGAVALMLKGTAAPADSVSTLTYNVVSNSDGTKTVNVYAWENVSGSDPTLAASTATATFSYQIVGL